MSLKLPLTDVQKGILFEIKRFKGRSYYVNQELLCFNTSIDVSVMHKAFTQLISKYEVLRSAIVFESHHPSMVIYQSINLPFEFYDYSGFDNGEKIKLFNSFLEKDFADPIDLTIAPLMRISMFKFAENDYRVIWDIHHIIVDGASVSKIIKDLFKIYSALLENKTDVSLKTIPYHEAHNYKNVLDRDEAKNYWKQLLSNYEFSSFLPCGNKKNAVISKKNIKTLCIASVEHQKIVDFINSNSLTVNTLLQATWAIVLSHYSNNDNIIFGSVRAYPKNITQNQVGIFINTLPMSFSIDFSVNIIDFLYKVREQGKRLRDYVMVSLNQIHEWSELPLDVPIYQSIINYEPFSLNKNLAESFSEIPCKFSSRLDVPYPLILEVIDDGGSLQLDLNYETEIFDQGYMESFLNHYKVILLQIISKYNKKLIELPVVDDATFRKVVFEWNDTAVDYSIGKTVHQLFEEQVEKNPNAPAVVFQEITLTYRLLNEKANQLAHYLLQQGIAIEDRIAIYLKPRPEVLVSILAVLKSGGAYVPLDVNNPPERIKHILQDSQPKVVITETSYLNTLTDLIKPVSLVKPLIINVDQLQQWNDYPKDNPLRVIQSSNLMYIIYTSGSTGKPKGSLIEHFSAINMTLSCSQRLKIVHKSRILQIASFSFDVSVAEWCMALLSGAGLYLIDKDYFSPQKIVHALEQYKITTIILAHSILAALPEVDLPHLKVIAPGGESLNQHTLTYWGKNRLLLNVYGITETSVCSTMAECMFGREVITVGKPLANVQIYILNKYLQLLPPGVIGEIHIGGYGVGRGYLNNPSLTQEKFIDDIFSVNNSQFIKLANRKNKLYKTGDLGRWTDNGEIEFVGRIDDQVKLRDFRIEMQEIEGALEKYPEIEKAVVVIKELVKTKQLIAYVLSKDGATIDITKLQKYLGDYLPIYMIPAQIVQIDVLPLTTHGKIDKKKLLSIENYTEPSISADTPSNQCEIMEKIRVIIRQMLQRQDISSHKNFLDIGLDSIMLVELSMKLSSEFGQDIDITTLFTYTTIDMLANFIKNNNEYKENNSSFNSIKDFIHKRKKH